MFIVISKADFVIDLLPCYRDDAGVEDFIGLNLILLVGIALTMDFVEKMPRLIG